MNKQLFDEIFEKSIECQIKELSDNNSLITVNELQRCKNLIFKDYESLMTQVKKSIFKDIYPKVMDRHRIASCMCGAFLKNEVFNIHKMIGEMEKTGIGFEGGFQYANELISFLAGCKILSFFMMNDHKKDMEFCQKIKEEFPAFPSARLVKSDFMNIICFNLHQIKDGRQIGTEHYDPYAYAMIYFDLEEHFYNKLQKKNN